MNKQWMTRTLLAISIQMILGTAYAESTDTATDSSAYKSADDAPVQVAGNTASSDQTDTVTAEAQPTATAETAVASAPATAQPAKIDTETTPSLVPQEGKHAAQALQQKEGDATQETNLQEVFTSNERQYSLIKKGEISTFYDLDYSYNSDTQINAALNSGTLYQFRVDQDAAHTLTNTFTVQYGLLDNLTVTAAVPFVAKTDSLKDTNTAGLGDVSFGVRWEPFPLKAGRLPLILFGSVSSKTGDSPYEINPEKDLSTGKGYYSVGVGASTRKYIDPVVLFASVSANYGFNESGLNQARGIYPEGAKDKDGNSIGGFSRYLSEFEPGITGGFSFGFAYSFNYDVSLTMSYQQSFNMNTSFKYRYGEYYDVPTQSSSMFSLALGVRVSPDTIVNGTLGFGLTQDSPDVTLGLSFPLDIIGLAKKKK
ncbi:hypothetical protein QR665_01070 [Acinetobacter gerneri]|uniref:putative pilus system protein FilC n=1 Tax=Acinetobacter gerneri TaxID=202952 RepID=UPI002935C244|nr:hypothetical protein [Acinetobacter gerneri]MDV2438098.1 hypothetical protein [Acinetobacter gerneri]